MKGAFSPDDRGWLRNRVRVDMERTDRLTRYLDEYAASPGSDPQFAATVHDGLTVPGAFGFPDYTAYPPDGHSFPEWDW